MAAGRRCFAFRFPQEATDAVDLSAFSKLPGRLETWFAVTPDDSILFLGVSGGSEIFRFHIQGEMTHPGATLAGKYWFRLTTWIENESGYLRLKRRR
jgi:hypothetical protein